MKNKHKSLWDEIKVNPFRENGDLKPLEEVFEELQNKISELPELVDNQNYNQSTTNLTTNAKI